SPGRSHSGAAAPPDQFSNKGLQLSRPPIHFLHKLTFKRLQLGNSFFRRLINVE
ncbi:hypothetical protein J6590_103421, partial [Homalodisca vitripennis]